MKFNHLVKHNGKMYPAGTDVPVGDNVEHGNPTTEEKQAEEKPKRRNTKKA